jgi:hypothetical protein
MRKFWEEAFAGKRHAPFVFLQKRALSKDANLKGTQLIT